MYSVQMVATSHSLKVMSLKHLLVWEWWVECIFQGQGWREGTVIVRIQLVSQPVVMSSQ